MKGDKKIQNLIEGGWDYDRTLSFMLQAIISYYYELCDKDDGMAIKIFDDETQIGILPFNLPPVFWYPRL